MGGHGWVCWVDDEPISSNRGSGYVDGQLLELTREQMSLCGTAMKMEHEKIEMLNEEIIEQRMQIRCLTKVLKGLAAMFIVCLSIVFFRNCSCEGNVSDH